MFSLTGRFSKSNPEMQNLWPRKTTFNRIVDCDFSQIELRIIASMDGMVDTADSKSASLYGSGGSSPSGSTN